MNVSWTKRQNRKQKIRERINQLGIRNTTFQYFSLRVFSWLYEKAISVFIKLYALGPHQTEELQVLPYIYYGVDPSGGSPRAVQVKAGHLCNSPA